VDKDMGAIGKAAVLHPRRQRGNHSICSFSAVSPQARALVSRQGPRDVYAPLEALAQKKGAVLLLGVGLEAVTLIHLAEKRAGRVPFRRWAYDVAKRPTMVEVGSCSLGFSKFESCLGPTMTAATVGLSHWKCFDARTALDAATEAIRANPMITHCGRACARCDDAVAGGPIVPGGMPDGRAE
jgi:aminoglycoside 3-N-acetyltransferase